MGEYVEYDDDDDENDDADADDFEGVTFGGEAAC